MTIWLVVPVLVLCALAAGWTVAMIVRDASPPSDRYFVLLGLLFLLTLLQVVVGLVMLAGTSRDVPAATFVAYLLTAVLVLPVGAALALVERNRWGTAVLLVAVLTVAAMETRLLDLWDSPGVVIVD